ncbi:MAG: hypothetical protein C4523_15505 [Myxococcales bacterium]|nr:MAG: hypothetical protein C4523_15505 [Myxococcales bacterium]
MIAKRSTIFFLLVSAFLMVCCTTSSLSSNQDEKQENICEPRAKICSSLKDVDICNDSGSEWAFYRECEAEEICCNGDCVEADSCDELGDGDSDLPPADGDDADSDFIEGEDGDSADLDTEFEIEVDEVREETPDDEEPILPDGDFEEDLTQENDFAEDDGDDLNDGDETDRIDDHEPDSEPQEPDDYPDCPADPYIWNHHWDLAYRLDPVDQQLTDVIVCGMVEEWFVIHLEAHEFIAIVAEPADFTNNSIDLFEGAENAAENNYVQHSATINGTSKIEFQTNLEGDHYFRIKREFGEVTATVTITLGGGGGRDGNDCSNPIRIDLSEAIPQYAIGGRLFNLMTNNYRGSCVGEEGRDMAFVFTLPIEAELRFRVRSDFDVGIYLRSQCESEQSEYFCEDVTLYQEEEPQLLTPGEYFLIVDAYEGTTSGWFEVSIFRLAPE